MGTAISVLEKTQEVGTTVPCPHHSGSRLYDIFKLPILGFKIVAVAP